MHNSSYRIMNEFADKFIYRSDGEKCKVLDVGSQMIDGQQRLGSYKSIFSEHSEIEYTGCDMVDGLNVDIVLKSPYNWSNIPANPFDFVISGQMLEHVEFPWLTFIEINRVLKPGGMCCIIAPSAGHMHNFPLDCYRYYPDGISALASYANLEVVDAFAQWEHDKYPHLNETWKDCVLIARKRPNTVRNVVKSFIKRRCIHLISRACLTKTEYRSRNPVLDPRKYSARSVSAKIYYDTGSGYNEANTVKFDYYANRGVVHLIFELPEEDISGLRFDPAESSCIVANLSFRADGEEVGFKAKNADITDGSLYVFKTNEPIFIIDCGGKNKVRTVSVDLEISECSENTADGIIKLISAK